MLEISLQNPDPKQGGLYINDTAAHTGDFRGVLASADSVVDLTGGTISNCTAVIIPKGAWFPCLTPYVKFASGSGVAYNR